ncbi:MAG: hypothetical protein KDD40_08505 [Bdellovibrionales bacterium]|nr:hypothetical protein [Bdellovibrionales bacterium]
MNFASQLMYFDQLPDIETISAQVYHSQPREFVLIYAEELLEFSAAQNWIQAFQLKYQVKSGEKLKSVENFPRHIQNLLQLLKGVNPKQLTFVCLGGGSVGDFGGFVASIYKRGVDLIHIPSTWLAAIDSAHGGKTALNVGSVKNQIGSFYPAQAVILVKDLFSTLGDEPVRSSLGELIKIGIVNSPDLLEFMLHNEQPPEEYLWQLLPQAIAAKMKIVVSDPYEKSGLRQQLNLGHTFGHVLETICGWPHGWSIAQGIYFSLHWSFNKGFMAEEEYTKLLNFLTRFFTQKCGPQGEPLPLLIPDNVLKIFASDKKQTAHAKYNFIFICEVGKVCIREVTEQEFLQELKRQGWF